MTEPAPQIETSPLYLEMRDRMLAETNDEGRMRPTEQLPHVYGAIVDVGFDVLFSVGVFADGTTSVYNSTGGVISGLGRIQEIEFFNHQVLVSVETNLDRLEAVTSTPLPEFGRVRITALTYDGRLGADLEGEPLLSGNEPLSDALLNSLAIIDRAQKIPADQIVPGGPAAKRVN